MDLRNLIPLVLVSAPLWAQDGGKLSGLTSGFAFDDQAHAIRVIVGVPGAAYLGQSVAANVDFASLSPDGSLAVVLSGGELSLLRLSTQESVDLGAWGAGGVDASAWNQSSDAVVLSGAQAAIYKNLKAGAQTVSLTALGSAARGVALDASAQSALAAASDGVYLLTASRANLVAPLDDVSAIALTPNGTDLFAASRGLKQIVTIKNWTDSAQIALFAANFEDPSALAISPDGTILFAASKSSNTITWFNESTGEMLSSLALDFSPVRADRLASGFFLLNARASVQDPLQLLDSARRTVFFVPAQDLSAQAVVSVED